MHSRPPASAYAAAVGMTVAFGLSFVATKYALRGFEPLLLALLRFTLAGGILCPGMFSLLVPYPLVLHIGDRTDALCHLSHDSEAIAG